MCTSFIKGKIHISANYWWCFHIFVFVLLSNRLQIIQCLKSDPPWIIHSNLLGQVSAYSKVHWSFSHQPKIPGTEKPLPFSSKLVVLDPSGMLMLRFLHVYTQIYFSSISTWKWKYATANESAYVSHGKRERRKLSLPLLLGLFML